RRRARAGGSGGASAGPVPAPAPAAHGRHKKVGHLQEEVRTRSPHRLGRLLLGAILLALIGVVVYALLFMPRAEESAGQAPADRTGTTGAVGAGPASSPDQSTAGRADRSAPTSQEARATGPGTLAKGVTVRDDPQGFSVAVPDDWQRRGENERGQVVYVRGDYELLVVPGRDKVSEFGADPMAYQQEKEPELAPYRASTWSGASGLRRSDVGRTATAEGTFNWNDSSGRQVYVRNAAMIQGDRYHLLQVIGPMDEQRSVDAFFEQAMATYRVRD
ncbi:serine/threonine protein kinase, partial [Streptomyces sp. NPDC049577]